MSKLALRGASTGDATFTIESPATNTDRTLVLPDNAGTVLTSASDLAAANLTGNVAAARITDALNAGGSAPIFACRAWVNFNGQGGASIRASGNVSSVTRTSVGVYTVNFSSAMPDANYAVSVSNGRPIPASDGQSGYSGTPSTSSVQVYATNNADNNFKDFDYFSVAIFR